MTPASLRVCPACGAGAEPTDKFCEACGSAFDEDNAAPAVAVCRQCPSGQIDTDGYCEQCGQRAPSVQDHVEIDLGALVGVSDKGHRHRRNEDAMALTTTQTSEGLAAIAVVCDGVSSSERPDEASTAAADKAVEVLVTAVRAGIASEDALLTAALAADSEVRDLAGDSENAPATTFVAGVATAASIAVCWLGDSRAYWLPADRNQADRLLTRDDSLAEELVAAGALAEDEAFASPHAHVITRWLGADADAPEPHTALFAPPGPGILLLCSDGLWNYEPAADGLGRLTVPTALTDLPGAASALLTFALDAGGQDNITIVLAAVPPSTPEPTSPESVTR